MRKGVLLLFLILSFAFSIETEKAGRQLRLTLSPSDIVYFEAKNTIKGLYVKGVPFKVGTKFEKGTVFTPYRDDFIKFQDLSSGIVPAAVITSDPDYVRYFYAGRVSSIFLNPLPMENIIFEKNDKEYDEYAIYPGNSVFDTGAFDLIYFRVYSKGDRYFFQIKFRGEITNPWDGPQGFCLQNIDIYIGRDPSVKSDMLPYRANNKISFSTDLVINLNGYNPRVQKNRRWNKDVEVYVIPENRSIYCSISRGIYKIDAATQFYVLVMGYDGYSAGQVRRVGMRADEWIFGGNNGRIIRGNIVDDLN